MTFARVLVTIGVLAFAVGIQPPQAKAKQQTVRDCSETHPGEGPAYTGAVQNSDFNFYAKVPFGLTAWGGVDKSAPFHGFTIFLDAKAKSCIVFEVHVRVDKSEPVSPDPKAKSIQLGKAEGWQTRTTGVANGAKLINVETVFSFERPDQIDDGYILLVTPTSNADDPLSIYDSFLHSLEFGR
jgi:hypothetical protein